MHIFRINEMYSDHPENLGEFREYLMKNGYEIEERETNHEYRGSKKGIMICVKDKKRPNYTICFDFTSDKPNAYEFLYFVEKDGEKDNFFYIGSTMDIEYVKDLNLLLDVKGTYKKYFVDYRKKVLKKAEAAYKRDVRKNGRFASDYDLEIAREKLKLAEQKYNSI